MPLRQQVGVCSPRWPGRSLCSAVRPGSSAWRTLTQLPPPRVHHTHHDQGCHVGDCALHGADLGAGPRAPPPRDCLGLGCNAGAARTMSRRVCAWTASDASSPLCPPRLCAAPRRRSSSARSGPGVPGRYPALRALPRCCCCSAGAVCGADRACRMQGIYIPLCESVQYSLLFLRMGYIRVGVDQVLSPHKYPATCPLPPPHPPCQTPAVRAYLLVRGDPVQL